MQFIKFNWHPQKNDLTVWFAAGGDVLIMNILVVLSPQTFSKENCISWGVSSEQQQWNSLYISIKI